MSRITVARWQPRRHPLRYSMVGKEETLWILFSIQLKGKLIQAWLTYQLPRGRRIAVIIPTVGTKKSFNKSYSFALLRKVISLAVRGNCPNIISGANFRLNFSECKCNGLFTTLLCYEHGWRLFCVCFAEAFLKFAYRTAHVPKVTSAT